MLTQHPLTTLQTKYCLDMHAAYAVAQLQAKHNVCYQTLPTQKVKIAKTVIGTHSVGKSTLCYKIALEHKLLGESVHIVQERVRFSPCPINSDMTGETLAWTCCNQISKEIEAAQRGFSVLISDRSPLDPFAYARYNSLPIPDDLEAYAKRWMKTYHKIFFVRPDQTHTPFNDGIRSTDLHFIHSVDSILAALTEDVPNIEIVTTMEVFT